MNNQQVIDDASKLITFCLNSWSFLNDCMNCDKKEYCEGLAVSPRRALVSTISYGLYNKYKASKNLAEENGWVNYDS